MTQPTDLKTLEHVSDGLYATPSAPLPYGADLVVRAFFIQRPGGNLIVYNAPGLKAAASEIAHLGGAVRQLINHSHEAMFGPQAVGVPVFVGERDQPETARSMPVAGTFVERQMIGDDFEIIPTPGHTPGTTVFLWDNGTHRFLFTGDTLSVEHGQWLAVVLGTSDRAAYVKSLEVIRELDFDVLVPWAAEFGKPAAEFMSRQQARERVDAVLARVRAGENR